MGTLEQIEMFSVGEYSFTLDEKVAKAKQSIRALMEQNVPIVCAFSGGKDSGVVTDLVLTTARQITEEGVKGVLVVISTSDTLIENPEVNEHYYRELDKMSAYGKKHNFQVIVRVARPSLLSTWQLKILTGRGIPSFAGQNTDCSDDLKVKPQAALRKKLFADLAKARYTKEPVTCLGTRFDESERRAMNMKARGENMLEPVRNKDGDLVLSPIADFTTDDVWEYIALAASAGESYSDFEETKSIYAHAEGAGCAIVAEAIRDGLSKRKKGGCGARHGCFLCQQSEDKSLENMVAYDQRYAYARGLLKLNKFIRATRYDWNRRHWVGRTIKAGYVTIQPDTYHPRMVREIFRYMLQLDYDEMMRARAAGDYMKFQVLTPEMIVGIDAYWSLNGLARPFSAWADYRDVYMRGIRYDIPEIEPYPQTDLPDAKFLYVGEEWDDTTSASDMTGLRDPLIESLLETSACGPDLKHLKDGKAVWDIDTEKAFEIHEESVEMLMAFELDNLLEKYDRNLTDYVPGAITQGYKYYLMLGAISLSGQQMAKHDEILRRTAHKDRLGLTLDYDIQDVLRRSVRFADLPSEARKAWGGKATTDSAQFAMQLAA